MTKKQFYGVLWSVLHKFPQLNFVDVYCSIVGGKCRYHITWDNKQSSDWWDINYPIFNDLGLTLSHKHAFTTNEVVDATEKEFDVIIKF